MAVPPVAFTVALYPEFATAFGNEVVVIVSGAGLIVILRNTDCVCIVGVDESVTMNCRCGLTAVVGVPETTPVDALSERPAGINPLTDQAYGGVPPLAVNVAE